MNRDKMEDAMQNGACAVFIAQIVKKSDIRNDRIVKLIAPNKKSRQLLLVMKRR
jgi:hypothetical protein